MRDVSKTINLKIKDEKGGFTEESFFVARMPLRQATHAWDIIMKTYGKPLTSIMSKVYVRSKGKKGEATVTVEDIDKALSEYVKECEVGQTFLFLETILKPDFVKYQNEPIALSEVYSKIGLFSLFKLSREVCKFNFEDFFF